MMVTITPKSCKARQRLKAAGSPTLWAVTQVRETVQFSTLPGPWFFVVPEGPKEVVDRHSRWVNKHRDPDFIVNVILT